MRRRDAVHHHGGSGLGGAAYTRRVSDLRQPQLTQPMVLTLEPGIEVSPGRILVHEENIVIESDGARFLSSRADPEILCLEGSA